MLELFHAAPSYYSMVARLALAEAGIATTSRLLDIHLAKQQLSDDYRALNPHMTVPTLRGPDLLLTDSSEILAFAAARAGAAWADADPTLAPAIGDAVQGHYAISIETLTATPAPETLAAMRAQVRAYLQGLPPVADGAWLFGSRLSSADVVLAVLLARLTMAAELPLLDRPDLQGWWQRYQGRPAVTAADLWTRFQRRRFLEALLEARRTPILSHLLEAATA